MALRASLDRSNAFRRLALKQERRGVRWQAAPAATAWRKCWQSQRIVDERRSPNMTHAALYARYSSDNQREASIEDQFRLCRERAAQERWEIVGSYEDAALSGSSTILRSGIQRLVRDAQRGDFKILLAEALDRISRDQADVATLYKQLKFAGVSIVTLAEGEISELHVGLKGTKRLIPERPRDEDASRFARARREGQGGRRFVLRLQGGEEIRRQRRADPGRPGNPPRGSADYYPHLPRVCFRQKPQGDCC
ncbi:recombinase family protein [Brucella endophytica]|uniref:recombinase family protein n=1 Tax=Brucella endophytica TaxID=1963359 RepID=UPI001F1AB43F|nr:recombinase family protein [Brucella endophytica]